MVLGFYDLVNEFASRAGLTKVLSKQYCEVMLDVVMEAIRAEDTIKIYGFGSFVPYTRKSHPVRSVNTGEWVDSAPRKDVKFILGKKMKQELNESIIDE